MSAIDILGKLSGIEIKTLDPVQRVLLTTDGTLTDILEAAFLERVRLVKTDQQAIPADVSHAQLQPESGESMLERKILLQGENSGGNYAYAESVIAYERFDPAFRDELLNSAIPLGRLWLMHRLETFKELQDVRCVPADRLCRHFGCAETALLFKRTYCVFIAAKVAMMITEYFPVEYIRGGKADR